MDLTMSDIAILACPQCRGSLQAGEGLLVCSRCRTPYKVTEGIPDLLPWSGRAPGPEWARWREKLDLLQQWRRTTWDGNETSRARQKVAVNLATEFFKFLAAPDGGLVVEVGCGDGGLRRYLPGRRYWGVDPLPLMPSQEEGEAPFPLVRAVGERLPFADGSFDAVVLCEMLDHCLEPDRVIAEAHRVVRPAGMIGVMQSVRMPAPRVPLPIRLRVAAGRLKSRLLTGRRVDDADTKVHPMEAGEPEALLGSVATVTGRDRSGAVIFLRGVVHSSAATVAAGRAASEARE